MRKVIIELELSEDEIDLLDYFYKDKEHAEALRHLAFAHCFFREPTDRYAFEDWKEKRRK